MDKQKAMQMIGLARKAGKLTLGGEMTENDLMHRKSHLVIVATDASEKTAHRFQTKCASKGVPILQFSTKEELGRQLGKEQRTVLSVTDPGFADLIARLISNDD